MKQRYGVFRLGGNGWWYESNSLDRAIRMARLYQTKGTRAWVVDTDNGSVIFDTQ